MRDTFLRYLDMPKQVTHIKHIPKKVMFEQVQLPKAQSKLISTGVESIYVIYVLNEQTTNITKFVNEHYSYEEILWVYIKLRITKNVNNIAEIIQKVIPNPLVCVFESIEGTWSIVTATKRINLKKQYQVVIENIHHTHWINPMESEMYENFFSALNLKRYPINNLYEVYSYIERQIICVKTIELIGSFISKEDCLNLLKIVVDYESIIDKLKKEKSKADKFSIQMEIHIKICEYEKLLAEVVKDISGKLNNL